MTRVKWNDIWLTVESRMVRGTMEEITLSGLQFRSSRSAHQNGLPVGRTAPRTTERPSGAHLTGARAFTRSDLELVELYLLKKSLGSALFFLQFLRSDLLDLQYSGS
jgi:hypothetical protein